MTIRPKRILENDIEGIEEASVEDARDAGADSRKLKYGVLRRRVLELEDGKAVLVKTKNKVSIFAYASLRNEKPGYKLRTRYDNVKGGRYYWWEKEKIEGKL